MRSFKYCIWLLPVHAELNIFKNKLEFQPHLTVQSDIASLPEALDIYDELEDQVQSFQVTLGTPLIGNTNEKDFYSYKYNVIFNQQSPNESPPDWWTNHLHVSVFYKYDEPLTIEEVPPELRELSGYTIRFDKIAVASTGEHNHYEKWKVLHSREL